ncbi:MAG TPA: antitoxin VapB family protein, partial [Candidatus Nanoarchaeia archaeon]|nr:antitoxin VapB family protein [Candidatus Nanoarchaeia archaeon]
MATKTISIMDDVYGTLKALKAPGESFSDEIRRLTLTKGSIMEFAGVWNDLSEKDAKKIEERIRERRKDRHRLDELPIR